MSEPLDDLVTRWRDGWAGLRGWTPRRDGDLVVVPVGRPGREVECIVTSERLSEALAWATAYGPRAWVTVVTTHADADERRVAEAGLEVLGREWLMTAPLDAASHPSEPDGYVLEDEPLGEGRHRVVLRTHEGDLAAEGQSIVRDRCAVFDSIVTQPEHRRRGLGSVVMRRLQSSVAGPDVTGVLVATPDGAALYRALGWTEQADVVIGTIPPA